MKKYNYIIVILLFTSCLGTKKTIEKTAATKQVEKKEVSRDSVSHKEVNRAINNEYVIPLKSTDSIVNNRIREALANFKAGAKSGKNSTRIVFDEDALALKVAAIVGETQNTNTATNNEVNNEKTFEESVTENTKKIIRLIPWYVWLIVGIWFFPNILEKVKSLVNPLSSIIKR